MAIRTTTRDRIRAAAHQHGWTGEVTIFNGPDSRIDVFERTNPEGGTDIVTVSFDRGRFTGGSRTNNVPADQGGANDTFWRRIARGQSVAHEGSRSPKGRAERIIASFV
jgi:hypothetical protein